ncbi:hypothetical protein [Deinococcus xinjiangensis]|uniref:hypothetical protein n=1 Tax=Deinococcus xinjiangensis TaxID=457454 RepID=UPI003EBE2E6F
MRFQAIARSDTGCNMIGGFRRSASRFFQAIARSDTGCNDILIHCPPTRNF